MRVVAGVLAVALGLAVGWRNVQQHRGRTPRWRNWAAPSVVRDRQRKVLVQVPLGCSSLVLLGIVVVLGDHSAALVFAVPMLVVLPVFFASIVLPLPIPRWTVPRWARPLEHTWRR